MVPAGTGRMITTSGKYSSRKRKRGDQPTGYKGLYRRDEQEGVGSYKSRGTERGRGRIVHLRWHKRTSSQVKAQGMVHHEAVTELFRSHNDAITLIRRLLLVRRAICSCPICVGGALRVHRLFNLLET